MIKIYGKGDTVSSEYFDNRNIYNSLKIFLEDKKNDIGIRNNIDDIINIVDFIDGLNRIEFFNGGVIKNSFGKEFNIENTDYHIVTINNKKKYYVRLAPGIAGYNYNIYINKPAVELAAKELTQILNLTDDDEEGAEILYDYENHTFTAKIYKIINDRQEILEFNNNGQGYKTGVELLENIRNNSKLTKLFDETVGDDLLKINLELTVEIKNTGTYYWNIDEDGNLILTQNPATNSFNISNFTITNLDNGFNSFDNTHTYIGSNSVFQGDVLIDGDLTVNGISNLHVTNVTGDLGVSGTSNLHATNVTGSLKVGDNYVYGTRYITFTPPSTTGTWYTIATATSGNVSGKFTIYNSTGGKHGTLTFYASIHFGQAPKISVVNSSRYGTIPFDSIRIGYEGTYDGAVLQIRVNADNLNSSRFYLEESYTNVKWTPTFTTDTTTGEGITPTKWNTFTINNSQVYTGSSGNFIAAKVYNAVWNDLAEYFIKEPNTNAKPGDVIVQTENGVTASEKRRDQRVIGVYSDTFGFVLYSADSDKKLPIGLSGTVNVKIREPVKIGDLLVSDKDGYATKATFIDKLFFRESIFGKVLENYNSYEEKRVRILIL